MCLGRSYRVDKETFAVPETRERAFQKVDRLRAMGKQLRLQKIAKCVRMDGLCYIPGRFVHGDI